MDIALNFINNSNDTNNSQIVIFQKNVATNFDELAVAGKVIESCGQGDNHPFVFSTMQAGVSKPTIWIGVASQVVEGQVMDSTILAGINTELSLEDIASADIVMTGGGPGANSTPFAFNLENIVMSPTSGPATTNMLYLTDTQRSLLAPADGSHPYGGTIVPSSDQSPFVQADAWCWALCGEYVASDAPYSAVTIYTSDEGAFVFNDQRVPVGLNPAFFNITDIIFPRTVPYHQALIDNLANALAGYVAAQEVCQLALMQLTATLNGHTVLPADGSPVYTMVMKTAVWYRWDHWAIGIQGPDTGATTTYQQKENGAPLQYDCGAVWDDDLLLQTVLRLDGLLQPHVAMLNNVV